MKQKKSNCGEMRPASWLEDRALAVKRQHRAGKSMCWLLCSAVLYSSPSLANPAENAARGEPMDWKVTVENMALEAGDAVGQSDRPVTLQGFSLKAADLLEQQSDRDREPQAKFAQGIGFPDTVGHWSESFVEALAALDIIRGFPDGSFRPDDPVTRAQFAAMIRKAFQLDAVRSSTQFEDVPASYWGYDAIDRAYQIGFLEGYPNNVFIPEQNIPRVQVLVSLANGLDLSGTEATRTGLRTYFRDAENIPNYALDSIAAAAENRLVVNYPNVSVLNPDRNASRGEVAAFIYQALVRIGEVPPLPPSDLASGYIVDREPPVAEEPTSPPTTSSGDLEALQRQFLISPEPPTIEVARVTGGAAPGSSSGTPTGFGAGLGRVYGGFGFQARTRYTDEADGTMSFGFGAGNPRTAVGVETTVSVLSLLGNDAFERGGISFKVHRFLPNNFAIAAGVENAIVWGFSDAGTSAYGVVTKVFRLKPTTADPLSRLTVSLGVGSGRFRSEDDFLNDEGSVNVFGSLGLRITRRASAIANWTGQDLTLGASFVPFRNLPIVISPAVADITGNAGDGARFIMGVGYSYSFSF